MVWHVMSILIVVELTVSSNLKYMHVFETVRICDMFELFVEKIRIKSKICMLSVNADHDRALRDFSVLLLYSYF